ncbi:MAG: molybdopterin molybdotransferase MoeA [Phyllobacteriaceae bacterium]|nr:molybdopterin molybdotransferase MoeA [Phyllobacteriaceae bacterium]
MLTVSEALARILDGVTPLPTETVPLDAACGRTLAHGLTALRTQPPQALSAMDGYAVRSADCRKPGAQLAVIGSAPAGHPFYETVNEGEAVRLFTGSVVPKGADAVVIQENVEAHTLTIHVSVAVEAGANIRPAGIDFRAGDLVLPGGTVLTPRGIALAAAADYPRLGVVRKPVVAVLSTGDELREPGTPLSPGQIIASNGYAIAALARANGADVLALGIIPDDSAAISAAFSVAMRDGADVIVSLGGASVGEHDLVRDAFAAQGMALDFWKVAMRPGKPLMFGTCEGVRVLGLPGNPVSSYVCAQLFLLPLLAAMLGRSFTQSLRTSVLANALPANGPREHYARAQVIGEAENGLPLVQVFADQDSSLLTPLASADCLLVQPAHAPPQGRGDMVTLMML